MADPFPLGSIPQLSAWEGETLTFKVTSGLGGGAKFSKRAIPSPKGRTSVDEKTGLFTYEPSPEDKEEFAVWIRARAGAKEESQKVYITPHPQNPSDFNIIEHVSGAAPDPASRFYTTFSQEDAGAAHFNRKGLDDDAKVMTTKVTVAGVKLVIEENKDEGSLYNRLKDRDNLRQLILCADEVVIRCELKVPGTDVHIYSRRLRFEDDGDKIGRILTTPLPYKAVSTRDVGLDGQKAGDVHLFVGSLETPGNADRIITVGGTGQDARHGEAGAKGADVPVWNGKVTVEGKEFDFSNDVKKAIAASPFPTGEAIMVHVGEGEDPKKKTEAKFDFPASDRWPGDGKDPVRLPGRNGRGGDGGSVFTQFKDQLESRVKLIAGSYGKLAPVVEPSAPGKPVHAIRFWFLYRKPLFSPPQKVHFALMDYRTSQPGKRGEAPTTMRPMPKRGAIPPLVAGPGRFPWLHPAAVRAVIAYANDAYLSGHTKEAREVLAAHLEAVSDAGEADGAWPVLRSELASLSQRIEGPYDFFGNPAGWVPMLSFQANHRLFEGELDSAIRAMFLAYWIQYTQARAQDAARMLEEARKHLRAETDQALADYNAAERKVANLETEMASIADQIESTRQLVSSMKDNLVKQVEKDLKTEQMLRASAKILGGVMQLVPVGQPVLGSFGAAFTVLGDIDIDKPADSLGGIAGAFAPVVTEKIGPKAADKASKLFAGLKQAKHLALTEEETKAKEKKEEFNKAVEKKELANKVTEHIKKKDEAKKSILGGFSGFAVSEEDVKSRLEKVLADVPAYGEAVKAIEALNARKRDFAEELLATIQAIDDATSTVVNNQLAILELRDQRDLKLEQLNLEALQSVQDMGRRARERLLLYQYYLLKSYHYLMLEDLPALDFRAQKLFDAFAEMVVEKKGRTVSPDGMLTEAQFKTLSGVFEQQLKAVAERIIGRYQTGLRREASSILIELSPAQIETLNSDAKKVELDLLWHLNRDEDDIRITGITANSTDLAEPLPKRASNLSLDYVHDGVSKVRRDGRVFLFRSGQYRIEGEVGRNGDDAPRTDIHWGTKVTYNPRPKKGQDELKVEPTKPDPEEESLVRYLIGAPENVKSPMTSFRPGAWAQLAVKRSGDEAVKIKHLTLEIHYVFQRVNEATYTTVAVKVRDDARPYVRCDAADANERADGVGSFLRTFKKSKNRVTLHAPSRYGKRDFLGWVKGGRAGEDVPLAEKELLRERSLTLDLRKTSDYIVEPVYAPVTETPVNDKGEEWPACPVGWVFDDWMFVNGTTSELTIDRIIYGTPTKEQLPAAVNEPQGDTIVKLSFERLKLLKGESSKLSVCIKPDGSGANFTAFGWRADSENYQVNFSVEGRPGDLKKDGHPGSASLDVDNENRILTFARH